MRYYIFIWCFFAYLIPLLNAQIENLYCGVETCYEVLGISRHEDSSVVRKAYRKMAREYHPDTKKTEDEKIAAEAMFRKIANAYEILKDDEQRKEYDYMLDNPEEMYYHYYRYYRRIYGPKIDVRIVLAVIITLISLAQYYSQSMNYREAVAELSKLQRYRTQAKQIALERGLLNSTKKNEFGKRFSKEELKLKEESVIQQIVEEKMDIRGGYEKPSFWNVLWIQLFCFPFWILRYFYFWIRWIWLFWILRKEYGRDEKLFLIRKNMNISKLQFKLFSDEDIESFLDQELWRKDNYKIFAQNKAEAMRTKVAEDSKYKRYRRYLKKGGPGSLNFNENE